MQQPQHDTPGSAAAAAAELRAAKRALRDLVQLLDASTSSGSPTPPPSPAARGRSREPPPGQTEAALRQLCGSGSAACGLLPLLLEDPQLARAVWRRRFGSECRLDDAGASAEDDEEVNEAMVPAAAVEAGDIVELRYYCLPHLVIAESPPTVVGEVPDGGKLTSKTTLTLRAIHYGRPSLLEGIRVMRDDFSLGKRRKNPMVTVRRYPRLDCRPPSEAVARAVRSLGQTGHSLAGNNASHFARWCRLFSAEAPRTSPLDAYEEANAELRPGDRVRWPAPGGRGLQLLPPGRLVGVGRRRYHHQRLLGLRLRLPVIAGVNACRLEFGHERTLSVASTATVRRYRLGPSTTAAADPSLLARRAAAFRDAVFLPSSAFAGSSSACFAWAFALALARPECDALAVLALGEDSAGIAAAAAAAASQCGLASLELVSFADVRAGDVIVPGEEQQQERVDALPCLVTGLHRHHYDGGSTAVEVTTLRYGHAPIEAASRQLRREFRCFLDCASGSCGGGGGRAQPRVCLHDSDDEEDEDEEDEESNRLRRRLTSPEELLPGMGVSFRRAATGVADWRHSVAFQHAMVVITSRVNGSPGQVAELDLVHFCAARGRLVRTRQALDLDRDEVFEVAFPDTEARPLGESLARAESRLGGVEDVDDATAWRLGCRYHFAANNSRQFVRWCRLRELHQDDEGHDDDVEWLQPWQSRLSHRRPLLPEPGRRQLHQFLHRCVQAAAAFPEASPLSAAGPLMSACLRLCDDRLGATAAAAAAAATARQVGRAVSPDFFPALAAAAAVVDSGEEKKSSPQADTGGARAFLVATAAVMAATSGAVSSDAVGGVSNGGSFAEQLAGLRKFFRP